MNLRLVSSFTSCRSKQQKIHCYCLFEVHDESELLCSDNSHSRARPHLHNCQLLKSLLLFVTETKAAQACLAIHLIQQLLIKFLLGKHFNYVAGSHRPLYLRNTKNITNFGISISALRRRYN